MNSSKPKKAEGQECNPKDGRVPKPRDKNDTMVIHRPGTSHKNIFQTQVGEMTWSECLGMWGRPRTNQTKQVSTEAGNTEPQRPQSDFLQASLPGTFYIQNNLSLLSF